MANMRLAPGFHDALQARLATPEGKEAMGRLVGLIAEAMVKAMPPELVASMDTPAGQKVLKELWPEIVDAYFRGLRGPSAKT